MMYITNDGSFMLMISMNAFKGIFINVSFLLIATLATIDDILIHGKIELVPHVNLSTPGFHVLTSPFISDKLWKIYLTKFKNQ